MTKRWWGALIIAGATTGALAGCGGGSEEPPAQQPPVTQPDSGGGDASKPDTTTQPDTTQPQPDTGRDTTVPTTDASDTGTPTNDASDTGTPSTDADDTGTVVTDTGTTDSGTTDAAPDTGTVTARTTPTEGRAVALTKDNTVAVAVNRTHGTVSVFDVNLDQATLARKIEPLRVGTANSEPWMVVIGNDDNTAYVILRNDQKVVRINNIKTTPTVDTVTGTTGSEPTGLAISPTGRRLYVANWAEGTVTVLNSSTLAAEANSPIDLNGPLAGTGMLGTSVSNAPDNFRQGLAHPRALVVTNNGNTDDDDETLYATEFFSQGRPQNAFGDPSDGGISREEQQDIGRQGLVYRINTGTRNVGVVTLSAIRSTGFVDSTGADTGCFPNQLYAATLNNNRLYVTALCESPRGPIGPTFPPNEAGVPTVNPANFKTQIHTSVFVVSNADGSGGNVPAENTSQHLLLTKEWNTLYDTRGIPAGAANRRLPLIANDIAFMPEATTGGGRVAYLTSYASDAVFRIVFNADGSKNELGLGAGREFINLGANANLPVGIALPNGTNKPASVVINENSRTASLISFSSQTAGTPVDISISPITRTPEGVGRRFFVTGLGRWSLNGQGWNSCETCHPDGLTDNVTWYFARGPRQSTSLDGTYDKKSNNANPNKNRRILNWTAIFDEVHDFELNTRGNSGGLGAIVHQNPGPDAGGTSPADRIIFDCVPSQITDAGSPCNQATSAQVGTTTPQHFLSGSTQSMNRNADGGFPQNTTDGGVVRSVLNDWDEIDAYMKTIRSPKRPTAFVDTNPLVTAGEALFKNDLKCQSCHGDGAWTLSKVFYTPNETNNAKNTGLLNSTFYRANGGDGGVFPATQNPPFATVDAGNVPFRIAAPVDGNDQINCILRGVGTFAPTGTPPFANAGRMPVAAWTGAVILEVRPNPNPGAGFSGPMQQPAQGATGFNPPSLLGLATGAPYFHAGNARTLEELISDANFAAHLTINNGNFSLDDTKKRQLVAYLLSIDDQKPVVPTPTSGNFDGLNYDPNLCKQFTGN